MDGTLAPKSTESRMGDVPLRIETPISPVEAVDVGHQPSSVFQRRFAHAPVHAYDSKGTTHAAGVMGVLHESLPGSSSSASQGASAGFANPGPLGLSAFAVTTLLLSLLNAKVVGYQSHGVVLGLAFFYGGAVQMMAGMWEMAVGNTFGATAFTSYGGFWMSWAFIATPSTGALAGYKSPEDVNKALGLFLAVWTLFSWMMCIASLKTNMALVAVFLVLSVTFPLLTVGAFIGGDNGWTQGGGICGVICALLAFYTAFTGLMTPGHGVFRLPNPKLS